MNAPSFDIRPYAASDAEEWDDFVENRSGNGTVFQTRRFLSYHPEGRFEDRSVLVRSGGELVCVVPTALRDGKPFSHPGTSCGGPVVRRGWWTASKLFPLADALRGHYGPEWGMRLGEPCFSEEETAGLLWAMGRGKEVRSELAVVADLENDFPIYEKSRHARNNLERAEAAGMKLAFAETDAERLAFHAMLSENLKLHGAVPTHSAEELLKLCALLGDRQRLALLEDGDGRALCGIWMVRATERVWHTQYVARLPDAPHPADSNPRRGDVAALHVLAMRFARSTGARFLSRGVCTENGGEELNGTLYAFKERQGGRPQLRHSILPRETGRPS
ncbi:MAG: hypothetical protein J6T45_01485 [Fibrobacterales bacterium]|nr:hypothetical protein [Fibrobacterales bacterium]